MRTLIGHVHRPDSVQLQQGDLAPGKEISCAASASHTPILKTLIWESSTNSLNFSSIYNVVLQHARGPYCLNTVLPVAAAAALAILNINA